MLKLLQSKLMDQLSQGRTRSSVYRHASGVLVRKLYDQALQGYAASLR